MAGGRSRRRGFGDRGHGEADKVAALKFLKRIMKKYGQPKSVVTDGLCSYPAAMKQIGNADRPEGWPSAQQPRGKLASALSTTKLAMRLFRNQKTLQKFSSIRAQVHNHSTRNVISSPAKSTNKDARLRWPNGAQSWPDPHVEFLSRQTHTVVHRSRFCLTRPWSRQKPTMTVIECSAHQAAILRISASSAGTA